MEAYLPLLAGLVPWGQMALQILGALVVVGQVIVAITPSKKDDELLDSIQKGIAGKLLDAVKAFAPIQKK